MADFIESGRSKQLMDDVAVIAANLRASSDMLKEQLPPLLTESHSTIADAKEFVGSANARLQPLLDQTQHLMSRLGLASDAAKVLLNSLNNLTNASKPQLDKLLANLNNTVGEAELTLKDTRATLHDVQGVIAPDSPVRLQLVQTLDDAQHTLDALRTLLDNLNRNPQILLLGE